MDLLPIKYSDFKWNSIDFNRYKKIRFEFQTGFLIIL